MANNFTTGQRKKNGFVRDAEGNRVALTSPYTTGKASAAQQYATIDAKNNANYNRYLQNKLSTAMADPVGIDSVVAIPTDRDTYQPNYTKIQQAMESYNTQRASAGGSSRSGGAGGSGGSGTARVDTSPYIAQLNSLYDQIVNRKPFQYDLNGDLLYKQMADQYTQLGQQAMRDTMGQAAALTGGYGNSYANQVGNQAYQQYLTALNQQIPDLYDRAYNAYQDDTDWLLQQYQMAAAHPGYLEALTPTQAATATAQPTQTSNSNAKDMFDLIAAVNAENGTNVTQYTDGKATATPTNPYFTYIDYIKRLYGI